MEVTHHGQVGPSHLVPLGDSFPNRDSHTTHPTAELDAVAVQEAKREPIHLDIGVHPLRDEEGDTLVALVVLGDVSVHIPLKRVSSFGGDVDFLRHAPVISRVADQQDFHIGVGQDVVYTRLDEGLGVPRRVPRHHGVPLLEFFVNRVREEVPKKWDDDLLD